MGHQHVVKVTGWGFDEKYNYKATEYTCMECNEKMAEAPKYEDDLPVDHTKCSSDCFRCKSKTLQMNTGDASRDIPDKKWNAELKAYRNARDQGLQPAGTTMSHIEEAHKASEVMGTAYNAETMPKAKDINKKSAEVMKEIGQI